MKRPPSLSSASLFTFRAARGTALLLWLVLGLPWTAIAQRHAIVQAQDGSGVFGYKDTPLQPWSGFHVHDPDRPGPPRVDPGPAGPPIPPPSDAVVLFGGLDLSAWQPHKWSVEDGCLVAGEGNLTTRQDFGDCQLHVEWMAPEQVDPNWGNRGNNGVELLGLFEVQIYDSYEGKIYPDGQAAAVYAQTPPLVNACRKPGQWQTYDIVVTAPVFQGEQLVRPARLTMFHNGVLVHRDQEIYGNSPHGGLARYAGPRSRGPVTLLGHHCPVRFRNLWIRPLATPAGPARTGT
jgi:hypothetical protein